MRVAHLGFMMGAALIDAQGAAVEEPVDRELEDALAQLRSLNTSQRTRDRILMTYDELREEFGRLQDQRRQGPESASRIEKAKAKRERRAAKRRGEGSR